MVVRFIAPNVGGMKSKRIARYELSTYTLKPLCFIPCVMVSCFVNQIIELKNKNIMPKCRIIERTNVDGRKSYVIQQKHFLFRWWWVDAWINSDCGAACTDSFSTLEEAQKNLCYFDDSKCVERVVS